MSRRKKIATAAVSTVTAALVVAGTAGAAQAAATPAAGSAWTSATVPVTDANLLGVAQVDAHTTWAAGFTQAGSAKGPVVAGPVLLTKKDGDPQGWVQTPTAPLPSGTRIRFNAVTSIAPDDGWLVSDDSAQVGGITTEHWDGSAWTLEKAPAPPKTYADSDGLLGVSGLGDDDVWAAGWTFILQKEVTTPEGTDVTTYGEPVVEHWNGSAWTIQKLPNVKDGALNAIDEVSAHDIWATGYDGNDQPLLLHSDGTTWTRVSTPAYTGLDGEFTGITADGPNDVWAVGRTLLTDDDPGHALVEHWDGSTWTQVATPSVAGRLASVAMTPQGVVAVGRTTAASFPGPGADGYAMRYSGGAWHSLGLPAGTLFDPQSVAVSSLGTVTAVGPIADPSQEYIQPMILSRDL